MRLIMKTSELQAKNKVELQTDLISASRVLFGLRMQIKTQQLSDTSKLRKARRDIARVRTVINQKKAG